MLSKDNKLKAQDFFNDRGFQQIKLWKWRPRNKSIFKRKQIKLNSIKQTNEIEKWLSKNAYMLCKSIFYWSTFLKKITLKYIMILVKLVSKT